jgi:glycosyltransferase involved in cell wall biosynthesis
MHTPLASIVINNYNYASFLKGAIESALDQTYPHIEIVVVDDGSSDGSREIIASYADRVVSVLKENGGQASALNAGVSACRGEILCFLDSDDYFYPDKVAQVVDFFCSHGMNSKPMLLHHSVAVKNLAGDDLPGSFLARRLHQSPMNLYDSAKRYRFLEYLGGPTTGISINRMLADKLFPIPEKGVRVSADDFIVYGSFLIADAYSMNKRLSAYRLHGSNYWYDSDKSKTRDFRDVLDKYLNAKLVEDGKQPVISFYDSMFAWSEFVDRRQWAKLAPHMLKLSWKQRDLFTATYVWHTVVKILRVYKRALIQSMRAPGEVRSPSKS